jgi:hypothetical protein
MKFYIFIFNEYQINVYRISSPYGAKIILVTWPRTFDADLEEDQKLVNELVMESTPVVTSASEDEDKDSDDSSESSKSSRRKKKFKFDFTGSLVFYTTLD